MIKLVISTMSIFFLIDLMLYIRKDYQIGKYEILSSLIRLIVWLTGAVCSLLLFYRFDPLGEPWDSIFFLMMLYFVVFRIIFIRNSES